MENCTIQKTSRGGRNSNLELFRIITMFFIIAHHYVVNSGLVDLTGPIRENPLCGKSLFLLLFGAWGKTGINCFVFITGYFMCKSNITMKKFLKLIGEIYFYKISIYLIFLLTGREDLGLRKVVSLLLPLISVTDNFTGCYLLFFLCIPFLNILINNLDERMHQRLIILLLFIYTGIGSIPLFSISFNYVTWFCVLYIISSYVRLYPHLIFENTRLWLVMTCLSVFFAMISVVGLTYVGKKYDKFLPYYFLADSNKVLAVSTAFSSFMLFKNLNLKYNSFINLLGTSTFGIFLIHTNSNVMRQWLWNETLNNVGAYSKNIYLHSIFAVICVFILASFIDIARQYIIEKNVFKLLKFIDK